MNSIDFAHLATFAVKKSNSKTIKTMNYLSTRGDAPILNFEQVLLAGLARDGGLYLPESWPMFSPEELTSFAGKHYAEVAATVMQPFVSDALTEDELQRLVCEAYSQFEHQSVAPLVQIGPNQWVMELFHGPTLAFKDVAMQVLSRLYDHVLTKRDQTVTIVGATSGDTGSAAIEAVRHCKHARIFILHPHGRTSEVQRRQMTTVMDSNVHNLAIEGTFDDCQAIVKSLFNDHAFRDDVNLSGVNSINWARVLPQAVYYITAAASLGLQRPAVFSVPTGNFGDIFAGFVAMKLGLPIEKLLIATNVNDILSRTLNAGDHSLGEVTPTMSPSMDIQISSNFERLLFELHNRDPRQVVALMQSLKEDGKFELSQEVLEKAREHFAARRVDETQTLETIRQVYEQTGYLIDPHTAVGVAAGRQALKDGLFDSQTPLINLCTAHPAKFPDAVKQATGVHPPLPAHLSDLYERDEQFDVLPAEVEQVKAFIRSQ